MANPQNPQSSDFLPFRPVAFAARIAGSRYPRETCEVLNGVRNILNISEMTRMGKTHKCMQSHGRAALQRRVKPSKFARRFSPQQPGIRASAAEVQPSGIGEMVGAVGFEPTTSTV